MNIFANYSTQPTIAKLLHLTILLWTISIPVKNSVYHITTGALCLIWIYLLATRRESALSFFSKYKDVFIIFSIIPLTMAIANIANGLLFHESWGDLIKFIYRYLLIFFALLYFHDTGLLSRGLLATMCLLSLGIYGIDGFVDIIAIMFSNANQAVQGLTFNRNIFGLIMHSGIVLSVFVFLENHEYFSSERPLIPSALLLLLTIFSISLVFSYSRAAWIASVIFIACIFCANTWLVRKYMKIIICFCIIITALVLLNEGLYNRFLELIHLYDSLRLEAWHGALGAIKEQPFFGYGFIGFESIVTVSITSVHNSTLEILFNTGLIGLTAFMMAIFITTREIIKNKKYSFLAVVASFVVISQFDHSIFKSKIFISQLCIFLFFVFSYRKSIER